MYKNKEMKMFKFFKEIKDYNMPLTIYLVVVNEGEGFVVDYYSIVYQ